MPDAPGVAPGTARRLLARAARAQSQGRVPSLVAGVFREGALAWSCGRGDLAGGDPVDVQYRLGSITKTVTAVAVLRLRDEGLLDLGDALDVHVPSAPLGDRSVAALLTHLGGIGAETSGPWWERTAGGSLAAAGATAALPAGRRFHYSNVGFALLGELVARLRGRPWIDVVTDEVLLPLGMRRTTPRPVPPAAAGTAVHPWADVTLPEPEHDAGAMAPAGQLWSTAADLARLGGLLLGESDVLGADTVEEMTTPANSPDPHDDPEEDWSSYGLGVSVVRSGGATLAGHGGSMPGFLAGLSVDRAEGTGALALANATSGLDGGLTSGLLADLRELEPRVAEPWAPQPPPVDLGLLGLWYWGPAAFVLRAAGGLLLLDGVERIGRSSRFRLRPDGSWVGLDGYYAGETLQFGQNSFTVATFVFTRAPYDRVAPVPGGVDDAGWR